MSQKIQGVLPVVHMPYNTDLSIDHGALEAQIDWLFATGAQGFCLALVSDLLRLSAQERLELPARLVGFAKGRGPVIISTGAESTLQAQAFSRAAQEGGAAAVMAIPPLSRALSEAQLQAYFEGILEAVEIPLIVQDASSYVGKAMSIDFQAGLFQRHGQRILFKPEATPLGPCISALRARTGGKAALFEGSGGVLLIDSHRRGVTGTIPGVELLDGTVALWRALEAGDEERAYALYYPICSIVVLQMQGGLDGFIVTERHLMAKRGLFKNQVHRGPLSFELDQETRDEIDRLFARLQKVLHS